MLAAKSPGACSGAFSYRQIVEVIAGRRPARRRACRNIFRPDRYCPFLDRRRRRLQRVVEIGQGFLLVLGGHLLVGLDLGDLRLDDGFGADIFLGRGIEAAQHQADIVDDGVVFLVARKAGLLGDGVELGVDLRIRLGVLRNLVGDRVDVLLRREHGFDLLLGQRDLLEGGRLRGWRRSGLGRRGLLGCGGHLGLRQHVAAGNRRHCEGEAGNTQDTG